MSVSLPPDLKQLIMLYLPMSNLVSLCNETSTFRLLSVCHSWYFWAQRAYHYFDFPMALFQETNLDPQARYEEIRRYQYDLNRSLSRASIFNQLDLVKYLVNRGATNINEALIHAAHDNYLPMAQYLIDHGATDLDLALVNAATTGHLGMVQYLINRGATRLDYALGAAEANGRSAVVQYLESLM